MEDYYIRVLLEVSFHRSVQHVSLHFIIRVLVKFEYLFKKKNLTIRICSRIDLSHKKFETKTIGIEIKYKNLFFFS